MELWGYKTFALFDVWSIEHFFSGASASLPSLWLAKKCFPESYPAHPIRLALLIITATGLAWEVLEHYLETGLMGEAVAYWFQGVETWANRMITDMGLLLIGGWIALRYGKIERFAQCFSLAWLVIHALVFPHSMYLQTLLDGEADAAMQNARGLTAPVQCNEEDPVTLCVLVGRTPRPVDGESHGFAEVRSRTR